MFNEINPFSLNKMNKILESLLSILNPSKKLFILYYQYLLYILLTNMNLFLIIMLMHYFIRIFFYFIQI